MFADHQPAAVSEEEAARGVVRIGVCLRVAMMQAVVPDPLVDVVLAADGEHDHQKDTEWEISAVGAVSPESVCSCCDAEAAGDAPHPAVVVRPAVAENQPVPAAEHGQHVQGAQQEDAPRDQLTRDSGRRGR